nr:hypothetical protein [uncultured Mucilaginibacter sp.]
MKILTPAMHGYIDYLFVVFLWAAPTLFVLPDDLGRFAYLLGIAHLALTICTENASGIFKFFSLPMHGLIELFVSIVLVILSYTYLSYDERARAFLLTYAALLLVVFLVTDYTDSEKIIKKIRTPIRSRDPKTVL